jgi:hypothetical protein
LEKEMAKQESSVDLAERGMWKAASEAQSLIELWRTAQDDDAVATLAIGILERFSASWDNFHHELVVHGRPKSRLPKSLMRDPELKPAEAP